MPQILRALAPVALLFLWWPLDAWHAHTSSSLIPNEAFLAIGFVLLLMSLAIPVWLGRRDWPAALPSPLVGTILAAVIITVWVGRWQLFHESRLDDADFGRAFHLVFLLVECAALVIITGATFTVVRLVRRRSHSAKLTG